MKTLGTLKSRGRQGEGSNQRRFSSSTDVIRLDTGWTLVLTPAGYAAQPSAIPPLEPVPAPVPGTVAGALSAAGLYRIETPEPLLEKDAWYRHEGPLPRGEFTLRLEGLATIAEVYLDDRCILTSQSMFESHDVPVKLVGGEHLSICFRALKPHLDRSGPRARWRPRMMSHQGLRLVRTTLLGHMPGWCPEVHATGPFRPVSLLAPKADALSDLTLQASLSGLDEGRLSLRFRTGNEGPFTLVCNGRESPCVRDDEGF